LFVKKLVTLFCTLAFLLGHTEQMRAQAAPQKLTISHLTADLYVYTTYRQLESGPFPSNSLYVITKAGVVMIDTPWDTTQFQPLLDSISRRHHKEVVLCIATHFHDDRTAGLEFLKQKGIATYSSKMTYELCALRNEKQAQHYFTNDTTFVVGGQRIHTYYPGKGHSADNTVIWFDKARVLYGGCLVKSTENQGLGNIADADLDAWMRSIRNVLKKYSKAKFVVPGHFDWSDRKSLQHTLKLLRDR
jgi:metallo-beta-lactamase class B